MPRCRNKSGQCVYGCTFGPEQKMLVKNRSLTFNMPCFAISADLKWHGLGFLLQVYSEQTKIILQIWRMLVAIWKCQKTFPLQMHVLRLLQLADSTSERETRGRNRI